MLVQILSSAVISLYTARARFEYKYKAVAMLNLFGAIAIPLLSAALIFVTEWRAEARIIASSLILFITALPILYIMLKKRKRLYSRCLWHYLLRVSLPLLPHYLASSLILKIGEIMINRTSGQVALGRYSVALSLGMSPTIVTGGVLSALSPWIIRKIREGQAEKIRDMLLIAMEGLCILCLGLLAVAPEAMAILSAEGYRSSLPAVYPLALSVIPSFLSNALMSGGVYYERGSISAIPSLVAAAVSTIFSVLLLPYVDYRYVGVFVLISYLTLASLNLVTLRKMASEVPIYVRRTAVVFLITISYAALLFAIRDSFLSRFILALPLSPALLYVGKEAYARIRE